MVCGEGLAPRRTRRPQITVTSERWTRVKEVFAEALERTGSARAAYLDAACGPGQDLRSEVGRLPVHAGLTLKSPVDKLMVRAPDFRPAVRRSCWEF